MIKSLTWLGILFLSISWLFFIPIFSSSKPLYGALLILIGIFCIIISFVNIKYKKFDKRYLVLLIPIIISIFFVNYPYNIGLLIVFIGVIIHGISIKFKHDKIQVISLGISFSGLILVIHMITFPFYSIFISHSHRVNILSPLVSFVGKFLGLNASENNGIVFIQTIQKTYPFTTTLEKLGFFVWFNIFIAALIIFILFFDKQKIIKNIVLFLIISLPYLIIRYIGYIHLYINTTELEVFWNPWYMLISFFPLALLLLKFIPLNLSKIDIGCFKKFKVDNKKFFTSTLIFIFIFTAVGTFLFQDPGISKSGRILIDEYHSDWEDSIRPLDKQWYGLLSTYNYYSLVEWIDKYYTVDRNNNTITVSLLNNYDILILKCPTNSYSNQEIWAIVQFVENGGGLYMIGDHTDVFGMNTYLNQISENFGITYKTDATYELETGMLSAYKPDKMFAHPIVQDIEEFNFMTSCTLEAPINSENVIIGNKLLSEPGTYSTENFFRESTASPESEYGYLLQVVAVKYGNGRVVAFSDSTVFSSFSIFSDGYPAFTLGAIEYLNRSNEYQYLNIVFFIIAIITLVLLINLFRNEKKLKVLYIILAAGLISFSFSTAFFSNLNKINYQNPQNHSDFTQICFEQEHSDFNVSLQPSLGIFFDEGNFGTFYVWTQRLGYFPSVERSLNDAVSKGEVVVIINPKKSFETEEINIINDYLYEGGKVLLMDSIKNSDSTANDLLGNFGLWLQNNPNYNNLFLSDNSSIKNVSIGNITSPFLSITGGEQILIGENNESYVNIVEFYNESSGKTGKLVVLIDSYTFSDFIMGGTFTEPDSRQLHIYNTEFYLFEEILLKDI